MATIERYTYREFVDYANNRVKHNKCKKTESRDEGFDFTQTDSFEQAIEYATTGWDLGLEKYKIEDGVLSSGTTHLNPSLAGCIPHVQNFIMGFPQQMYDLYDEREYNLPTLDLIIPLNYHGGMDAKNTLKFGKSLVSYINTMASTRNIRLTGVFCSVFKGEPVVKIVKLKDFDSSLVLNNIAFAFHPAFFRRLQFSIVEAKSYWTRGYGMSEENYKQYVVNELDGKKADETRYFKSLMNVRKFDFTPDEIENYMY